tara:strand:+ start:215 stop:847 length:633 start_codon:yes stop_codon:yes gene_type:complete
MNPKVRDRSKAELSTRKKEFLLICDILDNLEITFFLQTGILLGAIRENDFIKWDWDIEISVFESDFYSKIDLVVEELKKNNFKVENVSKKEKESKIDFIGEYPKEVTGYTIFSWNYSSLNNHYWRKGFMVPSKFLNKFEKINFLGRQFNCPYKTEEYLEYAYGDWKIPLRTSNKDVYFSKKFKSKKNFIINNFKNYILNVLYNLLKYLKN